MSDSINRERLFSEFPPVSTEDWKAKIVQDLKGADFDKKLVWRTIEGFNVQPFYRAEDLEPLQHTGSLPGEFPYVRGKKVDSNEWYIRQDIDATDVDAANKKALDVLMKGVTSLGFTFKDKEVVSAEELASLLKDVSIDCVEVNFEAGKAVVSLAKELVAKTEKEDLNAEAIKGSLNYDPIGELTIYGNFCQDEPFEVAKQLIAVTQGLANVQALSISAYQFVNAGSSIVQELGLAMAAGAEYMAKLTEMGMPVGSAASNIKFNFGVSGNYFMEIAKFRAAKLLWAKIVESFKPCCTGKCTMNLHAVTGRWNKTVYDPYVNMLRTTTEAMSAALGGVDSLTVEPFDAVYETPTEFAERIARNQQILLKEESYLDKVVDPAAGSYYIETLTASIAEEAWKIFLAVEEKGGYVEAFKAGFIQEQIAATAATRDKKVATRRENVLGTTQFPNFNEQLSGICGCKMKPKSQKVDNAIAEPLATYRAAMPFEQLRYETDKYSAENKRPKAFMLTIGNLAMRKARAQFACNFFAVAGYEVVDNNGFATVEEGVKAALDAQADIVVVCSSDDEYTEFVPATFEQLGDKAITVVAGAPACADELKAKGIENFINVKSNLLETLSAFQAKLGIVK